MLGLAGLWCRERGKSRIARYQSRCLISVIAGLALYDLLWAGEHFGKLGWYQAALNRGIIAVGFACFCAAVGSMGIALVKSRRVPGWGGFPLVVGAVAVAGLISFAAVLLVASPHTAHQVIYQGQASVALAFGLAWLPPGAALMLGRGARQVIPQPMVPPSR